LTGVSSFVDVRRGREVVPHPPAIARLVLVPVGGCDKPPGGVRTDAPTWAKDSVARQHRAVLDTAEIPADHKADFFFA